MSDSNTCDDTPSGSNADYSGSHLTLCDYFAVIGFDKAAGLQVDKYAELATDLAGPSCSSNTAGVYSDAGNGLPLQSQSKSPLDRAYQAKVLAHYPEERVGFPFVQEVVSLCMPKGLRFYTERKVPKDPDFHSFVLVREDGSRIYGCALLFYEELLDCDIRQQIYDLQMEHVRQMTISSSSNSLSGEKDETSTGVGDERNSRHMQKQQYPPGQVSFGNHTLPRKQSKQRGRSASKVTKRASYYDSASKPIYVSKCLCMITRIPIVYSTENLLRYFWSMCQDKTTDENTKHLPIESLIYWALHEVPLPVPGTCLQVSFDSCHLVLKRPFASKNELPFFDYPIQTLFSYISPERFLKLFTCFLLEHQILICSKFMDRLMLVAECLSTLVFPFRWQLTYVPILPYSQLKFIEAPVPYVMGLCYDERIPDQIFQSNVCIFDIDAGRLDYPEDIPHFPRQRQIIAEIGHIIQKFRLQNTPPATVKNGQSDLKLSEVTAIETDAGRPVVKMRKHKNGDGTSKRNDGELWSTKRMSRSFDNNVTSFDEFAVQLETDEQTCGIGLKLEQEQKVENTNSATHQRPDPNSAYLRGLRFNQAIRELFLHHFASLFACYENFLLTNHANGEENNRESMVNFDKASFLSDQPDSYLPFLAAFLETQMFASFVDSKILWQCSPSLLNQDLSNLLLHEDRLLDNANIAHFDRRIAVLISHNPAGQPRTPDRQPTDFLALAGMKSLIQPPNGGESEMLTVDYAIPPPHLLDTKHLPLSRVIYGGIFPELDSKMFDTHEQRSLDDHERMSVPNKNVLASPWKQHRNSNPGAHIGKKQRVLAVLEDAANRLVPNAHDQPQHIETPMKVAHQNWKFVEQLLRETKTKTKRMLVAKMGKEAVHLGHGDLGITGVEENTLVAGFCDLLERVWAHGLKKKQGKSALWASIFAHHDRDKFESLKPVDRYTNLSPEQYIYGRLPPLPQPKIDVSSTSVISIPVQRRHNESLAQAVDDDSKTLTDLIDSIKNIAKSLEIGSFEGVGLNSVKGESIEYMDEDQKLVYPPTEGLKPESRVLANVANNDVSGNWSQSFIQRAANFISDKIVNNPVIKDEDGADTREISTINQNPEIRPKRDDSRARFYHHAEPTTVRDLNGNFGDEPRRSRRRETSRLKIESDLDKANGNISSSHLPTEKKETGKNYSDWEQQHEFAIRHEHLSRPTKIEPSAWQMKQQAQQIQLQKHVNSGKGMKKSISISDFAPHWTNSAMSNTEETGGVSQPATPSRRPLRDGSLSARTSVTDSPEHKPNRGGRRSLSRPRSPNRSQNRRMTGIDLEKQLSPLPTKMAYDLKNVMRMTEIKTDIGFARAFVRLALERKLLHKHLKSVLSNTHLLQKMYKRYAFLRCEDEREQFLYHVLSLNAVDFSCFTHTFISTKIQYEVLLVSNIDRFSSSSIWVMLTGSLGSTSTIHLPPNSLQFTFDYKNLGILSTLRIGHSPLEGGKGHHPSKWFLDYVLVRNNITAQTFCFHCGRWFGRGVDDGALERLLVAERQSSTGNREDSAIDAAELLDMESSFYSTNQGSGFGFNSFISRPESPISGVTMPSPSHNNHYYMNTGSLARRMRSPSVGRTSVTDYYTGSKQTAPRISEIQHKLGVAVNALVKHFFTEKDYRSGARLTPLLCGENGLVSCLEQLFQLGRQETLFSNRLFRQPYPWDYVEKVFSWFANFFRNGESRKLTREQRSVIIYAYKLVMKISANTAVGKEGKFHVFVLLTLRDHILSGLLPLMAWTPVTSQMYDESAFLRQPHHLSYLSKLLSSLNEFNFSLEKSLTYGMES